MCFKWLFGGGKNKPLGKVVHYFDKIGVAVIKLDGAMKMGDALKFKRGEGEFTETIRSMQIDHQNVDSAGKGAEVAVKVSAPAKDGTLVFKA